MASAQPQLPNFDAATQAELRDFIEQEQAKAKIQASVHELTDRCWKTCMPGSISGVKFTKSEASCLENCVDRFLDTSLYIVKQIEQQKAGH
ncbi:Mitochondrial import inner membrane translocase subunit tim8 [Cryptotrichosporon argae]